MSSILTRRTQDKKVLPQSVSSSRHAGWSVDLTREFNAYALMRDDGTTEIRARDPQKKELRLFVEKKLRPKKIEWVRVEQDEINQALNDMPGEFASELEELVRIDEEGGGRIAKVVDLILYHSIKYHASDIHIESVRDRTIIRFRVDGKLQTLATLPKYVHIPVVARIKILANLRIDETRRPQDGRIEPDDMQDVSFRVSVIPTLYGEKVALRVLDNSKGILTLEQLGFSDAHRAMLLRNIEKPFGMILATGPTGSGKTTTLYALLNQLEHSGLNISTLEDPIEQSMSGVNQIQISPAIDLTFAAGLRALLRQDPDVLMVGEIRDSETMIMATHAAMTGHLVFSTLHTNDAASTFVRFIEMGIEEFVVTSITNVIIAQRLVRKVCSHCSEERGLPDVLLEKLNQREDMKVAIEKVYDTPVLGLKKKKFMYGKGCEQCLNTGYHGRLGIYELLEVTPFVKSLILEHADAEKIKHGAMSEGFEDIMIDGVRKVSSGETTFEEVLSATRGQ